MKKYGSLKLKLLRNLMSALFVAWVATLAMDYFLAEKTINQQLDAQLEQVAHSLSSVVSMTETIEIGRREAKPSEDGKRYEYQIFRDEKMVVYSANAPHESLSPEEGLSQNEVENKKWRVFSTRDEHSRVLVGQDLDVRKSLIRGMILSGLWPMFIAFPLIALILWLGIGMGLKPLVDLASAIQRRAPGKLGKINLDNVPTEVVPVVESLNGLLQVLDMTLEKEKQFTDNAAHELRTPLAAIKTQAQLALRSKDEREIKECILAVNKGIDRTSKMVSQLLLLARLDPENQQTTFSTVDLNHLVSEVISRFTPQALDKKIDLGLLDSDEAKVHANASYLDLMISNLIDNAIRYSPPGGTIDVKIKKAESHVVLTIEDHGPGIAEADRERVFDRFVRLAGGETEGSGIGLAIVKRILSIHHAEIELKRPETHSGLIVQIHFKIDS
jgi:two-component system sensor histidine kinase QseC